MFFFFCPHQVFLIWSGQFYVRLLVWNPIKFKQGLVTSKKEWNLRVHDMINADVHCYKLSGDCGFRYIHTRWLKTLIETHTLPQNKEYPLVNQQNYGKSPCLMGKSTVSTGPFSIAMWLFTRGYIKEGSKSNPREASLGFPKFFPGEVVSRWSGTSLRLLGTSWGPGIPGTRMDCSLDFWKGQKATGNTA